MPAAGSSCFENILINFPCNLEVFSCLTKRYHIRNLWQHSWKQEELLTCEHRPDYELNYLILASKILGTLKSQGNLLQVFEFTVKHKWKIAKVRTTINANPSSYERGLITWARLWIRKLAELNLNTYIFPWWCYEQGNSLLWQHLFLRVDDILEMFHLK